MISNLKIPVLKLASGNTIPVIGYGTYQLKNQQCFKGVGWAYDAGYRHIDSASIYRNEKEIKESFMASKVDRSAMFITSKIAPSEHGYSEAKKACTEILNRFNCSYLDLLLVHWPGVSKYPVGSEENRTIRRETWRALVQLKQEGKVKDIGVSNYLKHHLQDLIQHSNEKPAVNQFEIHPLLWQTDTIDFCRQQNIVIEAYSPLARHNEALFANQIMIELAEKHQKTIAQISLRWAIQHGFVVLPKSKTKERIFENMNIFDFELSGAELKAIDSLTKANLFTCWNPNQIKF